MAIPIWFTWVLVAVVGYLVYRKSTSRNTSRLPPGPKPIPVLGNINDLPPPGKLEYQHWLEHKDVHGPISSVTVMGMTLVIIHDKKAAHQLLDQEAAKTSGRPTMVMAGQLCGYEATVPCQGYTPTFRRYRKYMHRELGTKASAMQFQDVQEVEVGRQLVRVLKHPERWKSHLKTTAAAMVLKMAYGYAIEPDKPDMLVDLVGRMVNEFALAAAPMTWAVDVIPALRYLPEGIPGVRFKETARRWKRSIHASGYIPYNFVRRQMASFTSRPCYVSKLVQQLTQESADGKLSGEDEHAIIMTAVSLYGAAADTTVTALTAFTAAMIMFPEVQQKAQDEIDRVVGSERLPTFADRESLPYIDALVKEASRWWPISPMGFPHTATEDVEYEGMHIPKGSLFMPAVWWFLHDPDVYADPDRFDPDRFLTPRSEPDPRPETFGYGRRICPGRFFAGSSLFINIAQMLATFNFTKKVGKDGEEIDVNIEAKPGLVAYPAEFEFQISPRSAKHVTLIEQFERKHPWEAGDAELLDNLEDFTARD
ncbi:hypothetical protein G3M48_007628 [Beauveria asiatica]|uniref:O-methylsterigmatocystin oxidoreductase n=1 Tax=Beauveria asiatica TaxID=1069075 RepID=A0AAW0RLR6_9HYPO